MDVGFLLIIANQQLCMLFFVIDQIKKFHYIIIFIGWSHSDIWLTDSTVALRFMETPCSILSDQGLSLIIVSLLNKNFDSQ